MADRAYSRDPERVDELAEAIHALARQAGELAAQLDALASADEGAVDAEDVSSLKSVAAEIEAAAGHVEELRTAEPRASSEHLLDDPRF